MLVVVIGRDLLAFLTDNVGGLQCSRRDFNRNCSHSGVSMPNHQTALILAVFSRKCIRYENDRLLEKWKERLSFLRATETTRTLNATTTTTTTIMIIARKYLLALWTCVILLEIIKWVLLSNLKKEKNGCNFISIPNFILKRFKQKYFS